MKQIVAFISGVAITLVVSSVEAIRLGFLREADQGALYVSLAVAILLGGALGFGVTLLRKDWRLPALCVVGILATISLGLAVESMYMSATDADIFAFPSSAARAAGSPTLLLIMGLLTVMALLARQERHENGTPSPGDAERPRLRA